MTFSVSYSAPDRPRPQRPAEAHLHPHYYDAFAYPGDRLREVPDHLSVECGFLSFLAMKVAFARFAARVEEEAIARDAYDGFSRTHLLLWLDSFCGALVSTESHHYAVIARYLVNLAQSSHL